MILRQKDRTTLRGLAERYSEIAHLDVQKERIERYYRINSLEHVRPVVLISEVPWGEIREEALANTCVGELGWIETHLRQVLYQWERFQVDLVVPPTFKVSKRIHSTGIGVQVDERQIQGNTGAYISAHQYHDVLKTDEDLARLRVPELTYDREGTEKALETASEIFDGLLPVALGGTALHYSIWDQISVLRGVDALLTDLVVRPDFMHRMARRFMEIADATFKQLEALDALDSDLLLLHCTVACARDLPGRDFSGKVRIKDVWGRCAAQIFSAVSPEMHDEFDLAYNEKLFGACGLVYYGCCEPMDRKIDILRKRFKNLRKISITPWADPERAAEKMGGDFVMAAKPNPAFVGSPTFNPKPVEAEISATIEACKRHKTPLEFVLKDISTIANKPENLTQWAETVKRAIDRYHA